MPRVNRAEYPKQAIEIDKAYRVDCESERSVKGERAQEDKADGNQSDSSIEELKRLTALRGFGEE